MPKMRRVVVQLKEYANGQYVRSKGLTIWDATAMEVEGALLGLLKMKNGGRKKI
jgi:hypothetical protein